MVYYKKNNDLEIFLNVILVITFIGLAIYDLSLGFGFFMLSTFYIFLKGNIKGIVELSRVYLFFIGPPLFLYLLSIFSAYFN